MVLRGTSSPSTPTGNVGRSASIAYDATTSDWIIGYEDLTHGWFKSATLRRGAWVTSVVDSSTVAAGGSISVAFTPTHLAAMSYYDGNLARLKYAWSSGRKWYVYTLTARPKQGLFTNLSFDAGGNAHILYYNQSANAVYEATSGTSAWSFTTIAAATGYGVFATKAPSGAITASWLDTGGVDFQDA